jgi:very-short-patch-repair endonuclease
MALRRQAKALRANMTDAERRLWYLLRAHRFNGVKIKRQAPIGPYIVDFVSFERRLIFEVDGGQHADSEADRRRTRWLEGEGFRVLGFWNNEVLKNTSGVLETILSAIADPSPGTPLRGAPPSPTRGEGKESNT